MRSHQTKMMILVALFAAITAVCAQISFSIGPVPFTLQVLAISLTGMLLGRRWGTVSVIVYLLLGVMGAPVFAGYQGGLQAIAGKTGGYLLAFIPAVYVIGLILERGKISVWKAFLANLLGLLIIYAIGASHLKLILNLSWEQAFLFGVMPFIIPDLIKIVFASSLGVIILKRLVSAGFPVQTKHMQKNTA
ncbi:biotin transporter BioY [Brevibacillus humidisoli]|uniref:biotin transporter BioY n=1 Tax=Brevibacillus humidisoli TaxID=2895522 RepID=UPI001E3860DF|nr:biotin transporter BioY [Brevibacillus humidisoli]UFJ39930.1 biotin transporter BioY [Brevibacillus humidisoli]